MNRFTLKNIAKLMITLLVLLLFAQACQQRYWFRKKVGDARSNDSGEVEQDYKIIW